MVDDLFPTRFALERVPLADAEIYYLPELPLAQTAEALMKQLIDEIPCRAENIVVWGKPVPQPRLIACYGDKGADYTYSGIHHDPLPWTDTLTDIKTEPTRGPATCREISFISSLLSGASMKGKNFCGRT